MSILGNRVLRREDHRLLTDGGSYVADLDLPGAASVGFVRSPLAHARITSLDVEAARRMPGVLDVVVAHDIDLRPLPTFSREVPSEMRRPWLAGDTVRFVGDPVAVVVAERADQVVDAAEAVVVDYEPLPALMDVEEALEAGTLLFPGAGTNVAMSISGPRDERLFDGCEVVVRHRLRNQRLAPAPLEVRAAASRWDAGGRLHHFVSTQAPHAARDLLASSLGIEAARVHVVAPDVGGGFGAKGSPYPEELLVAWLARRVGRPCRWVETRSESMVGLGHGRGQLQRVALGGTREGRLLAYRLEVLQDAGAYPGIGAFLPTLTKMMASGVYDIPRVEFESRSVVTTTTPTVPYRGAGRPEAAGAIERAVDLFAASAGLDPADVRRKNLLRPEQFPFTTPTGGHYDSGDYEGALEAALERAGYRALREEQHRRRLGGGPVQLGVGLSVYVEVTNGGPSGEYGSVEIDDAGRAIVTCGTSPHGQGHETAFAMVVHDTLGVPMDDIEVRFGDTDLVPRGVGTFGSRSLQTGGVAVMQASLHVAEEGRRLAAELLEAAAEDLELDREHGRWSVVGTPAAGKSWRELAEALAAQGSGALRSEVDFVPPGATFPFGAHVAEVEVDLDTGRASLRRLVAADDAGTIVNPLLADGQVHGGLAQGVAQALFEEVAYDAEGNPLTATLADYGIPSAADLPSFELLRPQTPTPNNDLGAKGIGESGTIGSTPAVQNAVVDALGHLGVEHLDMPATPQRVWQALRDARSDQRAEGPKSAS